MRDRKPYHDPDLRRDKDGRLWITLWRAPEAPKLTDRALKAMDEPNYVGPGAKA